MHYSAKRGLATACRLSVRLSLRLSVTFVDCDHIGWNSSKIISRLVSVGRSLSANPNIMDLLQGEQPEIGAQSDPPSVDLSVGDIQSRHSIANCGRMVTDSVTATLESQNHHRSFEWYHR